jgi:2-(1,2-epoxy-1,2-dihydrophenyl)acetyl-CoA isomerase
MSSDSVLAERRDAVLHLTLNRPDVLNSFNNEMFARLLKHLQEAQADTSVRAVYLTGAGRGFCAGQDISGGAPEGSYETHLEHTWNPIAQALHALDKPVVCAVNGVAAGAGANLALGADIVIAAEEASFIQAFVNIGLVPDTGGTFLLPRLVGMAQAAALLMLGEKITAARAYEIGMIYRVVPLTSLESEAWNLAVRLSTMPTLALKLTKRLLDASATNTFEQQLVAEGKAQGRAGASADHREGLAAFQEKRKPRFTGQ